MVFVAAWLSPAGLAMARSAGASDLLAFGRAACVRSRGASAPLGYVRGTAPDGGFSARLPFGQPAVVVTAGLQSRLPSDRAGMVVTFVEQLSASCGI